MDRYKNVSFVCWDVGGKDKLRPLWRVYCQDAKALIFVVDSNDRDRMREAREELLQMLKMMRSAAELDEAPLPVFANLAPAPGDVDMGAESGNQFVQDGNELALPVRIRALTGKILQVCTPVS